MILKEKLPADLSQLSLAHIRRSERLVGGLSKAELRFGTHKGETIDIQPPALAASATIYSDPRRKS